LSELKNEFGEENDKLAKVSELKKSRARRENNKGVCARV